MQLPEADYSRGMSSLGREGQGGIASLESQASSKLQEGALYPKWASAKAAIAHDVVQFAAEVKGWEEARQEAKAVAALSEYHNQVAKAEAEVANARTYKASDIPSTVNINRFKKAPDGTEVEREDIEQWEAAPGMFDHYEKGFSEAALAKVGEGKAKIALSRKIEERRNQGQIKMKTIHYKGQLEVMQNDLITSATNFANQGKTKEAVGSIEVGVKNGTFSLDEGRKLTKDILEAGDETLARRELLATNDPAKLEAMQQRLLATTDKDAENPYPNLSPLKRLGIAQTIDTKRIELEKAGMTMAKQQRTMAADRAIIDADQRARAGKPMSQAEIQQTAAKNNMTDAEYRSLQATVESGAKVETTAEGAEATRQMLAGLTSDKLPTKDDRTLSREEAAEYYREQNENLYQTKKISLEQRNKTNSEIESWKKKIYDSPDFKDAEKYINTVIGKPNRAKNNNVYELTQSDFVREMRAASNASQGKFNAMAWAQENEGRFIKQRDDEIYRDLVRAGVQAHIKFTKTRSIDKEKTLAALESARRAKMIDDERYAEAMDAINAIPVETK